jgi:hypothetical protein
LLSYALEHTPKFSAGKQKLSLTANAADRYEIEAAQKCKVDLYCAGHTHGGQIALPFYGALITFSRFDKKYEAGFFHERPTWLYVNRGMGCEGTPHFRFFARPEVTMIELAQE